MPFKATRSALSFIKSGKKPDGAGAGGSPISSLAKSGNIEKARFGDGNRAGGRGTANNKTGQLGSGNNAAKNAIGGSSKRLLEGTKGNANNNKAGGSTPSLAGNSNQTANPMVTNAVSNALSNKNTGNGGNKK